MYKFNAHFNVEVCTTVKAIKYIYKYIYKGYDAATVILTRNEGHRPVMVYDEIASYLNAWYVRLVEAAWCLWQFIMHEQRPQ